MPQKALRGYLSFLLLIPLTFLLLTPLLLRPAAPNTTAFYLIEQTMNEQLAFKRALLVSAHQNLLSLKGQTITLDRLLQASIALSCPDPTTKFPTSFANLTSTEQNCLSRHETLLVWAQASRDWSGHSDYTATVLCQEPATNNFVVLSSPSAPILTSSSWSACGSHLSYSRLSTHLTINQGLKIFLQHKELGSNASGQLPSMEVGG